LFGSRRLTLTVSRAAADLLGGRSRCIGGGMGIALTAER
jgi:hypothetical protein